MNSIVMIMRVAGGILAFFFGWAVSCFVVSFMHLPHPEVIGTLAWLFLLGFLVTKAIDTAKAQRLAQANIVQASVERQAQAERDAKKPPFNLN